MFDEQFFRYHESKNGAYTVHVGQDLFCLLLIKLEGGIGREWQQINWEDNPHYYLSKVMAYSNLRILSFLNWYHKPKKPSCKN